MRKKLQNNLINLLSHKLFSGHRTRIKKYLGPFKQIDVLELAYSVDLLVRQVMVAHNFNSSTTKKSLSWGQGTKGILFFPHYIV